MATTSETGISSKVGAGPAVSASALARAALSAIFGVPACFRSPLLDRDFEAFCDDLLPATSLVRLTAPMGGFFFAVFINPNVAEETSFRIAPLLQYAVFGPRGEATLVGHSQHKKTELNSSKAKADEQEYAEFKKMKLRHLSPRSRRHTMTPSLVNVPFFYSMPTRGPVRSSTPVSA